MGSAPPWARVIIVNHNAGPLLQGCVDALAAQTLDDFEAVIVDNASSDGSLKALVLPDARFRIHAAVVNIGFAAANNLVAADCRASWIATLNPRYRRKRDLARRTLPRHLAVSQHQGLRLDADRCAQTGSCGRLRRCLFHLRHGVARCIGIARGVAAAGRRRGVRPLCGGRALRAGRLSLSRRLR
jgi:hypothetical protein